VVLVSAIAVFIIFGIRLSFAVFFAEFVSVESWSNEAAAGIFSVSMVVFAIGSTPAGILLDRLGPRIVFSGGSLLLAIGLLLSSQVTSLTQLMIAYGVIGGAGLAVIGLGPVAANIAAWTPPARRGRAVGIAFAGTGLGSLIFVPLSTWLIAQFGWRGAYLVLSGVCFIVLVPLTAFGLQTPPRLKVETHKLRAEKNWRILFRNPIFWVLMLVSLNALGPLRALTVHQIAYMESVGVSRQTAASFVGIAGFLTAGAYIGWGYISDRFGRVWAFTLGGLCLLGSVGVLLLLQTSRPPVLLMSYSILVALGEGTRSSQTTAIASDTFQDSGLGFVNGLVGAMFGLGAAFGPWIVGRLRDVTDSYLPGFAVVIVMIIISLVGFMIVSRRSAYTHAKAGIAETNITFS
jgi:MFS family permease